MNKKRVIVNAGLCLKTHAADMVREYCDKLTKRKIEVTAVDLDGLIFETNRVSVRVITYVDRLAGAEWDEAFGFSRELGIYLRKGHRASGFNGGVISYIVQEETR